MSRPIGASAHGELCRCEACDTWRAVRRRPARAGERSSENLPNDTPLRRALAAMPPLWQAASYALIQVGDLARVMAARLDPTPPPAAETPASSDEEQAEANAAAAGAYQ